MLLVSLQQVKTAFMHFLAFYAELVSASADCNKEGRGNKEKQRDLKKLNRIVAV
jgi:hypothetical protein